jgi:hypothetical protein
MFPLIFIAALSGSPRESRAVLSRRWRSKAVGDRGRGADASANAESDPKESARGDESAHLPRCSRTASISFASSSSFAPNAECAFVHSRLQFVSRQATRIASSGTRGQRAGHGGVVQV